MRSVRVALLSLAVVVASCVTAQAAVNLSPVEGPPGTTVTASGSGWQPSHNVTGPFSTSATSKADGTWTLVFTIPTSEPPGPKQYMFTDVTPTNRLSFFEVGNFTVGTATGTGSQVPGSNGPSGTPTCPTPKAYADPAAGLLGSSFTLTGIGWVPGGTVSIHLPYGSLGWFPAATSTPAVDASGNWESPTTVGTSPTWGPTPPGVYTFTVSETTTTPECSLSTEVSFDVVHPPSPADPAWITGPALARPGTVRLQWLDRSDNETGFEIEVGGDCAGGCKRTAPKVDGSGAATGIDWPGWAPGAHACFHVRAVNADGASRWTDTRCVDTPPDTRSSGGGHSGSNPASPNHPGSNQPNFGSTQPGGGNGGVLNRVPSAVCDAPTPDRCAANTTTTREVRLPAVQGLTRAVAIARARSVLAGRIGSVYTRATNKRLTCRARGGDFVCAASWRYRGRPYLGRVVVRRNGTVRAQVFHR